MTLHELKQKIVEVEGRKRTIQELEDNLTCLENLMEQKDPNYCTSIRVLMVEFPALLGDVRPLMEAAIVAQRSKLDELLLSIGATL